MVKRKRRLEKGIKFIEEQIKLHEEKKEEAGKQGRIELEEYYKKEIERLKETKEKKKRQKDRI